MQSLTKNETTRFSAHDMTTINTASPASDPDVPEAGGYVLPLERLEQILRSLPSVEDGVVLVRETETGTKERVAYVVVSGPFMPDRLMASLTEALPDAIVDSLPATFV